MRAWEVVTEGFDGSFILRADSRSKAAYQAWQNYTDAGYRDGFFSFRRRLTITRAPEHDV